MLRTEEHSLLVCALQFDALGLNVGIVSECLVNDTAVKGGHWFKFHWVTPTPNFLGCFLNLFHQRFACLSTIAANVHSDFWHGLILLKQQSVRDILQVRKRLALPSYESTGILGFHIEEDSIFNLVFLNGRREAK